MRTSSALPLVQFFQKSVDSFSSRVFLKTPTASITYGDFYQGVQRRRQELERQGVGSHHRLLYKGLNSVSMIESMFATWSCKAVFVPLCPTYSKDVHRQVEYIVRPFNFEMYPFHVQTPPRGYQDHLALVLFTSGTTSFPKGVLLSHENLCANLTMIDNRVPRAMVTPEDTSFAFLPWHHCYGLVGELLFLMSRGASLYLPSSMERATLASELRAVQPTLLFTVPKFLENVHKSVRQRLWFLPSVLQHYVCFGTRLRYMSIGGAPCSESVQRFYQDEWGVPLVQGYGATECSPMISLSLPTKTGRHCGHVFREIETRLDNDRVLHVRGPNVTQGYLTQDNTIFRPPEKFSDDGWFCTGDRVSFDADGHLCFEHRFDDTCWKLSNGKFVNPLVLEQHLAELDVIEQAVVLGHGSPSVKLLLYLSPKGRQCPSNDIPQRVRRHLLQKGCASYELPSHIHFLTEPLSVVEGTLTMKQEPKRRRLETLYQDAFS